MTNPVIAILAADPRRMALLGLVARLRLPDGWIGAGFVRSAVWDHLHGLPPGDSFDDVDVVWHDAADASEERDRAIEADLTTAMPDVRWSVTNQARMHGRHGHAPYGSVGGALRHWPETATAVAARLDETGRVALLAPYGVDDLLAMRIRPTPPFDDPAGHAVVRARLAAKRWRERWPRTRLLLPGEAPAG